MIAISFCSSVQAVNSRRHHHPAPRPQASSLKLPSMPNILENFLYKYLLVFILECVIINQQNKLHFPHCCPKKAYAVKSELFANQSGRHSHEFLR